MAGRRILGNGTVGERGTWLTFGKRQEQRCRMTRPDKSCSSLTHDVHYLRKMAPEACSARPHRLDNASAATGTTFRRQILAQQHTHLVLKSHFCHLLGKVLRWGFSDILLWSNWPPSRNSAIHFTVSLPKLVSFLNESSLISCTFGHTISSSQLDGN